MSEDHDEHEKVKVTEDWPGFWKGSYQDQNGDWLTLQRTFPTSQKARKAATRAWLIAEQVP